MAQDFERDILTGIGTIPDDIPSGADFNSDDTIIGINMANTSANAITASCFMTSSVLSYGADFNFTVTVANNVFVLDSQAKPAITLYRGFTYVFDQSEGTNNSHTLKFKTAAGGSAYTTGVTHTGTPGTDGKTTIVVAADAPSSLYYYSRRISPSFIFKASHQLHD